MIASAHAAMTDAVRRNRRRETGSSSEVCMGATHELNLNPVRAYHRKRAGNSTHLRRSRVRFELGHSGETTMCQRLHSVDATATYTILYVIDTGRFLPAHPLLTTLMPPTSSPSKGSGTLPHGAYRHSPPHFFSKTAEPGSGGPVSMSAGIPYPGRSSNLGYRGRACPAGWTERRRND